MSLYLTTPPEHHHLTLLPERANKADPLMLEWSEQTESRWPAVPALALALALALWS